METENLTDKVLEEEIEERISTPEKLGRKVLELRELREEKLKRLIEKVPYKFRTKIG